MKFELMMLVCFWITIGTKILENFDEDLEQIAWWRGALLQGIILIFGPVFFLEEILELIIDWILEEEEGEEE